MTKREREAYVKRVREAFERLRGNVSGVDDGDLLLILQAKLRPFGTGRNFFIRKIKIRKIKQGGYVH